MQIAFCLTKYFPFGGLQRDFLRISRICQERGHAVRVYTMVWEGERPAGFEIHELNPKALSNHRRNQEFFRDVRESLRAAPADVVVGFSKMDGLDVYYAADPCFEARAREQRSRLYRRSSRYRKFREYEEAVFSPASKTEILMIAAPQIPVYRQYYGTQPERFHLLPPGISRDRMAPADADARRAAFRAEFGLGEEERLVLMIGSGFRTKGLDRALVALGEQPEEQARRTRFFIIGQGNPGPFRRLIRRYRLHDRVEFLMGRDDVPRFLLGADLLIHPAYSENTGTALLEAVVAGLPVLVTEVCGYAHYIAEARAGYVLPAPFDQDLLNRKLVEMLDSPERAQWRDNGRAFGRTADLYSMPDTAADLIEEVGRRKKS